MNPTLRCAVFDVDGTLVDSEQEGHRPAFNEAFEMFGLRDRWDHDTYRTLLAVTGGVRRLRVWFSDPRSSLHDVPAEDRHRIASELHRLKTDAFVARCQAGAIPTRPGVTHLLDELADAAIDIAIATTGSRSWVEPLLERNLGLGRFSCIVTGDDVADRKPAPDVYLQVLEGVGCPAVDAIAIEDSAPGSRAATSAGIACVVVANAETDLDAVAGAPLVLSGFGDDHQPAHALHDPAGAFRGRRLTVSVLARALVYATAGTDDAEAMCSTRSSRRLA